MVEKKSPPLKAATSDNGVQKPTGIIFSDPSVTIEAKSFLTSPVATKEYRDAVNQAVSQVVAAILRRIGS